MMITPELKCLPLFLKTAICDRITSRKGFLLLTKGLVEMTNQYIGPFVAQMRRWQHANPSGSMEEFQERACNGGWISTRKLSESELIDLVEKHWFDTSGLSQSNQHEEDILIDAFSKVGGLEGLKRLKLIEDNGGLNVFNWLRLIVSAS